MTGKQLVHGCYAVVWVGVEPTTSELQGTTLSTEPRRHAVSLCFQNCVKNWELSAPRVANPAIDGLSCLMSDIDASIQFNIYRLALRRIPYRGDRSVDTRCYTNTRLRLPV